MKILEEIIKMDMLKASLEYKGVNEEFWNWRKKR